jgi:hypothetical protein
MLKILLAVPLLLLSTSALADLSTPTQNFSFVGSADSSSLEPGGAPFLFNKFDGSLGDLTGVFVLYDFAIMNGLLGADNKTNAQVSGSGDLGAAVALTSNVQFLNNDLSGLFNRVSLLHSFEFTLAADPTLSIGGDGPDTSTMLGATLFRDSGWKRASNINYASFYGGPGEKITINFDMDPTAIVRVVGAQGFFQSVDTELNMSMYYTYSAPLVVQPPTNVPAPIGMAIMGLAMIGFGARKRFF